MRSIVITGAGSGIGRAIAVQLASDSTAVALMGRRLDCLEATAQTIREDGGQASVHPCDITAQDQVDDAFAAAASTHNGLTGSWQIAGSADPIRPALRTALSSWSRPISSEPTAAYGPPKPT